MCTVGLRLKDKNAKARFFVVPVENLDLLGMPDIELLDILKSRCEVMGDPHVGRKIDPQTIQPFNSLSCKANKAQQIKADKVGVNDANSDMPYHFRSSINRAADKKASQVLMQKTHNKFRDCFYKNGCFEGTISLQVKDDSWPYQVPPRRVAYALQEPPNGSYKNYKSNK